RMWSSGNFIVASQPTFRMWIILLTLIKKNAAACRGKRFCAARLYCRKGSWSRMKKVFVIGAGLAGSEAAWQCAQRGVAVELFEMRPVRTTPAHQTDAFAELVCSNSLKSDSENTAPWLLKEEMRRAGSLLL